MKKYTLLAIIFATMIPVASSQASWWNKFMPQKQSSNASSGQAKDSQYQSLTPAQVKDVKSLIENELVANPEILIKASQALRAKGEAKQQNQAQQVIQSHAQALFNNPSSPTAGNQQGTVTLVEFFDYQCGHCKTSAKKVKQLIKSNPNLKVIYKELPIFGGNSTVASNAALTAFLKGKYQAFHDALFDSPSGIDQSTIDAINKTLSIDPSSLSATQKTQITAELQQNQKLAQALELGGTPAFIVTNQDFSKSVFIPGAVPLATLQGAISKVAATNTQAPAASQTTAGQNGQQPNTASSTPAANSNGSPAAAPSAGTASSTPAANSNGSPATAPSAGSASSTPAATSNGSPAAAPSTGSASSNGQQSAPSSTTAQGSATDQGDATTQGNAAAGQTNGAAPASAPTPANQNGNQQQ